jgi:hypothetical protein
MSRDASFGLDLAGEKSAGFGIVLQHGVEVRDRESSDKQVGLFGGAEFGNRTQSACGRLPKIVGRFESDCKWRPARRVRFRALPSH